MRGARERERESFLSGFFGAYMYKFLEVSWIFSEKSWARCCNFYGRADGFSACLVVEYL